MKKIMTKQKPQFSKFYMKTVCLKVNVSSAKINILFDGEIIARVKLFFLSCKEIPDYLGRI